jgi:hypothetical protein
MKKMSKWAEYLVASFWLAIVINLIYWSYTLKENK